MFSFIANLGLIEFWKLWGMLATSTLIGFGALAVFWFSPITALRLKQVALHVAAAAFLFTWVFGWGAQTRDGLCIAQVDAARARFEKLQKDIESAAEAERLRLMAELSTKEQEIDDLSKKHEALLANSKDIACLLTDEDVRQMK